jgi:hypothetical protein
MITEFPSQYYRSCVPDQYANNTFRDSSRIAIDLQYYDRRKPLVFLDLDETLIDQRTPADAADPPFGTFCSINLLTGTPIFYRGTRTHLVSFFRDLSHIANIGIWTHAHMDIAKEVVRQLIHAGVAHPTTFVTIIAPNTRMPAPPPSKDLSIILPFNMSINDSVFIVDDNRDVKHTNGDNAILVPPFSYRRRTTTRSRSRSTAVSTTMTLAEILHRIHQTIVG